MARNCSCIGIVLFLTKLWSIARNTGILYILIIGVLLYFIDVLGQVELLN